MGLFKKKIDIQAFVNMQPTSKFDLKMQCMAIAKGDVDQAEKMYDFLTKDLQLPDITVPPPTRMEQVKNLAGGFFGWVKENKDDLISAYNFIQNIRHGLPINPSSVGDAVEAASLPTVE